MGSMDISVRGHRSGLRATLALVTAIVMVLSMVSGPAFAQDEPRFSALVFTETSFEHAGEAAATAMIEDLGVEHGFEVVHTDDSSGYFTDEGLAPFDVVIFNNNNGTITNTAERHAFERYIHRGGGYVGLHSASNSDTDWEWYTDLLAGGRFLSHPSIQDGLLLREDTDHPSTAGLDDEIWHEQDEWYNYPVNPRDNGAHVLLTVDEDSYDLEGTVGHGDDHPISWCNPFDGGRSWYTALGHFSFHYEEPYLIEHIHGGIEWAAGEAEGDCGEEREGVITDSAFEKVAIDDDIINPMNLAVAPDGRVFYVGLFGTVKVWNPVTDVASEIAEIEVDVWQENGLLGIALDPDFLDNGWVYLFYTDPDDSDPEDLHQNVSRFTYVDGQLDMDSEAVLLEIPHQRDVCCHSSGDMHFDIEGNLIITVGDDTSWYQSNGYSPHDDRLRYDIPYVQSDMGAKAYDARFTSGNTADLRGKILRITPFDEPGDEPGWGSTYDVPDDNLFTSGEYDHLFPDGEYDPELGYPEIYAMGLRNPFKVAIDRETGWIYQGEVGPDANNDNPNRGPRGYDEFNQIREAGNFGWPYCIADNKPYIEYDWETQQSGEPFDCENGPRNDSAFNTGLEVLPPGEDAFIYYPYGASAEFPDIPQGGGRAAYGGDVYHHDPDILDDPLFPPHLAGGQFPEYYDGGVFLMDWSRQWIGHATVDEDGNYVSFEQFMPETSFARPHGMVFGPDGAMYLMEFGSGPLYGASQPIVAPQPDSGLYRIEYIRDGRSPVANASATPDSGPAELEVQFSSEGSVDPDGGELSYAWDFGDGETSTEADPVHTYTEDGEFEVQLLVTNDSERTDLDILTVTVGNTRPEVTIHAPADGRTFAWGDEFSYEVSVTDAEDGATDDDGIDCDDVTVQVGLQHAVGGTTHLHEWQSEAGCEGSFTVEADDDHGPEDDIVVAINATYTDDGGDVGIPLTGEAVHVLQPERKQAQFFTDSQGISLPDSGDSECCGAAVAGSNGAWASYAPYNLEGFDALNLRIGAPLEPSTVEIRRDAPDGELLGTAEVEPALAVGRVDGPDGFGNAVQLNSGSPNERITLPEGVVSDLQDFTIASWVNWDGGQTWTRIFDFGSGTGTNMFLTPNSGAGSMRFAITTTGAGGEQQINATSSLPTNGWQHVAVTLEGTTATMYLNGEVVGTNTNMTLSPSSMGETTQNWIGQAQYPDPLLNGQIDDFQIHSSALSASEVQALMASPGGESGGGDHLWYQFEEPAEGALVVDSSENGNGGSILVSGSAVSYSDVTVPVDDPGDSFPLYLVFPDGAVHVNYFEVGAAPDPDAPQVSVQATPTSGVAPLDVSFTGTLEHADVESLTYEWDFGDGSGSSELDPDHTYTDPGTYTATLTATDPENRVGSGSVVVQVDEPASACDPEDRPHPSDEFEGTTLDVCRWSQIVRENPDGYAVGDGSLTITAAAGDMFGGTTNAENLILQPVYEGEWQVETEMTYDAAVNWQQAGLILYGSDDDFAKFGVLSDTGRVLEFVWQDGGDPRRDVDQDVTPVDGSFPQTMHLRLQSDGTDVTAWVSTDGEEWDQVGRTVPISSIPDAHVGFFAAAAGGAPENEASFDHFRVTGENVPDLPDPTPPSVDIVFDPVEPDGDDGWYVSPVNVSLESDTSEATLEWREAGEDEWNEWTGPVTIDSDGVHDLEYRARVGGNGSPAPDAPDQVDVQVGVLGNNYVPDDIVVAQGGTVDYELVDGAHDVVTVDAAGNEVDASPFMGGDVDSYTFEAEDAGQFYIYCTPHSTRTDPDPANWTGMVGSLEVIGDGDGDEGGAELVSDLGEVTVHLDQTPPETSASLEGVQDDDGAYVDEVSVSLDADDGTSGVSETWYAIDGGGEQPYDDPVTVSDEGAHTVEFWSVDVAGNVEDTQEVSFEVVEDEVGPVEPPSAPTVELDPAEPDGPDGAYVSPVTVTVSSDDPDAVVEWRASASGDWTTYDGPVTFDDLGEYTLEARATNDGGSSDVASVSFAIVDGDPPVEPPSVQIGLDPSEPDGPDGAYVSPVTLTVSSDDPDAVVEWREAGDADWNVYDATLTFSDVGEYTVEARATNEGGSSDIASESFEIVEDDGGPVVPPPADVCTRHQGGVTFPDAPGSGHRTFIDCLAELGIVEGYTDGTFGPRDDVSRGQLASFVVRALELATGETMEAGGTLFPDVGVNSTHGQAIYKLRNAGIIRGYEDGTFRPRESVTRDQTARYVVNALELVLGEELERSGASFPDVAAGSQYAVDVDKLVTAGVIQGYADGTFGPREPVSRAQMTRFIGNALEVTAQAGAYQGP